MDESQYFLESMERLLLELEENFECESDFCPPPLFDLPPPPPPPWLDDDGLLEAGCVGGCNGPTAVVSSVDNVQQIVHHVSVIVVSSLIIVITVMLAAVIIWRRGRLLLRKFGSRSTVVLPTAADGSTIDKQYSKQQQQQQHQQQRTLPNHYTTTAVPLPQHQLAVDLTGRTVIAPLGSANTAGSGASLMIGGVPFHIIQQPTTGGGGGGQYGPASIYPVYETIGSDCSEKSSVYSDRQLSINRSPASVATGRASSVTSAHSATMETPILNSSAADQQRLLQVYQHGADVSDYFVYPVFPVQHPVHVHAVHGLDQALVQTGDGSNCRMAAVTPRHLPNLPGAARRTQSYRATPSLTNATPTVPINRTPLPPIPRSTVVVESSIGVQPTASSPITQL